MAASARQRPRKTEKYEKLGGKGILCNSLITCMRAGASHSLQGSAYSLFFFFFNYSNWTATTGYTGGRREGGGGGNK